jgi:hypothetical protein
MVIKKKTPAIRALKRGDTSAIHFIIPAALILFLLMRLIGSSASESVRFPTAV